MSADHKRFPQIPDSWPPGGVDSALTRLQSRHLRSLSEMDIPGLLRDPLLGRRVIVSSFGAESVALLHYVSKILPGIDVIFLDTRKHFAETLSYRRRLEDTLDISVLDVTPDDHDIQAEDPDGTLHVHDPDTCCRIRKTFPLQDFLAPFDTWMTGRKRFQGGRRTALPVLERDGLHVKVNPLAHWGEAEISEYLRKHKLPLHPLVAQGYLSIGCAPCTRTVNEGEDPRAGRWPQVPDKAECGIHLGPDGKMFRGKTDPKA